MKWNRGNEVREELTQNCVSPGASMVVATSCCLSSNIISQGHLGHPDTIRIFRVSRACVLLLVHCLPNEHEAQGFHFQLHGYSRVTNCLITGLKISYCSLSTFSTLNLGWFFLQRFWYEFDFWRFLDMVHRASLSFISVWNPKRSSQRSRVNKRVWATRDSHQYYYYRCRQDKGFTGGDFTIFTLFTS